MKFRNVFWGLSLILIGTLLIGRNLGWINFDWINILRLWPLLFILWGLSVLPLRENIKIGIMVILLGGATWFVLNYSGTDRYRDFEFIFSKKFDIDNSHSIKGKQEFTLPYADSVEKATLKMGATAGKFILKNTTSNLLDFSQKGRYVGRYEYFDSRIGHNAIIKINEKEEHIFHQNNHKVVTIKLNPKPVWNIDLNAGASSVNYDLSPFKIKKLEIDGGAGSFNITLGKHYPETDVKINAGASSITLRIPKSSGCDIEMTAVLSSKSLQGFKKTENGHYQTPNYDTAKNKIHLNVDAAVSNFHIERY